MPEHNRDSRRGSGLTPAEQRAAAERARRRNTETRRRTGRDTRGNVEKFSDWFNETTAPVGDAIGGAGVLAGRGLSNLGSAVLRNLTFQGGKQPRSSSSRPSGKKAVGSLQSDPWAQLASGGNDRLGIDPFGIKKEHYQSVNIL